MLYTAYLLKHKNVMNGVPLEILHLSFKNAPISNENRQLLSYLGFSLNEWSDFVHRVTFHTSNVTEDFESSLLPTYTALHKHALRANCFKATV